MIRAVILSALLALPLSTFAQDGDPITGFATDDAEMNAAMAEAQTTLARFLNNTVDSEGYGDGNASVKVAFPVADGGSEIIWVGPFLWDGGDLMVGILANQPNFMGGLNAGDPVEFSTDMVRDWSWVTPDGKLWGNYTTRVMIPHLDADMQAQLTAALSPDPVPAEWN